MTDHDKIYYSVPRIRYFQEFNLVCLFVFFRMTGRSAARRKKEGRQLRNERAKAFSQFRGNKTNTSDYTAHYSTDKEHSLSKVSGYTHTHTVYRVKRPRGTIAALLLSHETEVISRTTTGKLAIAY